MKKIIFIFLKIFLKFLTLFIKKKLHPFLHPFFAPFFLNEIHLIHYINQCENLIILWGTSFFKNYVYISDNCKKIIVLVMENSNFIEQYNCHKNNNILLKKFKNAEIIYKIIDSELNFNPFS